MRAGVEAPARIRLKEDMELRKAAKKKNPSGDLILRSLFDVRPTNS
jgi:hypothetical protein